MHGPYRQVPVSTLLEDVARARAAGDWRAAQPQWEACIARSRPRVEAVVDFYVHTKRWIRAADREDIVQNALIRAHRKLVENLDSLEEHAFFAAVVQAAKYQCMDDARKHLARHKRERPAPDDDAFNPAEAGEAMERWEREEDIRAAGDLVDHLVAQLDERSRRLITLQRLGTPDSAIAADLGVTMDNLYQIRSRALKTLRGLIDQ